MNHVIFTKCSVMIITSYHKFHYISLTKSVNVRGTETLPDRVLTTPGSSEQLEDDVFSIGGLVVGDDSPVDLSDRSAWLDSGISLSTAPSVVLMGSCSVSGSTFR